MHNWWNNRSGWYRKWKRPFQGKLKIQTFTTTDFTMKNKPWPFSCLRETIGIGYTFLFSFKEEIFCAPKYAFARFRRDTIVTRGDAQSKASNATKQVLTKGTFQRQMAELKKKIKTTIQVFSSKQFLDDEQRLYNFDYLLTLYANCKLWTDNTFCNKTDTLADIHAMKCIQLALGII